MRRYREYVAEATDTTGRDRMLLSDAPVYGRMCAAINEYPDCEEMADPAFKAAVLKAYEAAMIKKGVAV